MKTALITGASGKIGYETVKKFISDGYFVIGQYNSDTASIEQLKKELKDGGERFFPYHCDFTDPENIYPFFSEIGKSFKHIDVLINNAGIDLYKLLTDTEDKEWDKIFNVNVKSAFILSKLCLENMINVQSGSIVNVSSVWGKTGASMETAYSASKAAIIGLTKSLAKEVAPSNIRVNCVLPGVIDTKMNDIFSKEEKTEIIQEIPLSRMGKAEEVADLIFYLAVNATYITGECVNINGGFLI